MNFMIVHEMLVCSSSLISVCMFIMSKVLLISSATMIVRTGGHLVEPLPVTVMHVLLFVLHVFMLREYNDARVTAMLVCGTGVWLR